MQVEEDPQFQEFLQAFKPKSHRSRWADDTVMVSECSTVHTYVCMYVQEINAILELMLKKILGTQ